MAIISKEEKGLADDGLWQSFTHAESAKQTVESDLWDCSYFDKNDVSTPLASFKTKHLASDWQMKSGWKYDGVPLLNGTKSGFYLKCGKNTMFQMGSYRLMLFLKCDYIRIVMDDSVFLLDKDARTGAPEKYTDRDIVQSFHSATMKYVEVTVGVLKEDRSFMMMSWSRIHSSVQDLNQPMSQIIGTEDFSTDENIGCAVTPICHGPRTKCKNRNTTGLSTGEMPWGICQDFVPSGCLVYSFGIRDIYRAELLYGKNGCEVHAFDCTVNYKSSLGKNVAFHPWCLGMDSSELKLDGTIDGVQSMEAEFLDMPSIIRRLGHENRTLTILKMDCEGCEWNGLDTLIREMPTFFNKIDMLLMELHFVTNFIHPNSRERRHEIETISRVMGNFRDYRTFSYSVNSDVSAGRLNNPTYFHELYDVGLFVGACCYEFSMVRKDLTSGF